MTWGVHLSVSYIILPFYNVHGVLKIRILKWFAIPFSSVQETGIKTIPMEKKCKKAKWLSGEALQIAVKKREAKSKGGKERYKHLNAEFQRIARRDKKVFLSNQCKEIEENNRMVEMSSRKVETPREHFMQRWAR